jgi:hypothetical protein
MYCNACQIDHHCSKFSARQRRKSPNFRICRSPVVRNKTQCQGSGKCTPHLDIMKYLTESEFADLLEFGYSRIFVAERQEARYACYDDDDDDDDY